MATFHIRFPGGLAKAVTFSYDDGVEQDIRLVDILNRNGLKGTFNINTGSFAAPGTVYPAGTIHRRMTAERVKALFAGSGHEVAVHTLTHPFLEQLPSNMVVEEVIGDRKNIEDMFGTVTRGMAYPFGTTSDAVVEALKVCGIAYSRTTKTTEGFALPTDWLRLQATCHHNNPRLMELGDKFVNQKPDRAPWLFYVWGHAYEFESNDNWQVIENFAALVGHKDDIWYATNIEIYDYVKAFEALQFSSSGDRVFNPTCRELFFYSSRNQKHYSVKPGEMLEIQ